RECRQGCCALALSRWPAGGRRQRNLPTRDIASGVFYLEGERRGAGRDQHLLAKCPLCAWLQWHRVPSQDKALYATAIRQEALHPRLLLGRRTEEFHPLHADQRPLAVHVHREALLRLLPEQINRD